MLTYYNDNGAEYLLKENFYEYLVLSGWDIDDIGGERYSKPHECFVTTMNNLNRPVTFNRNLKAVKKGDVVLTTGFKLNYGGKVSFKLSGGGEETISVFAHDGKIYAGGVADKTEVCEYMENIAHRIKLKINLDSRTAEVWIDGINRNSVSLVDNNGIDHLEIVAEGGEGAEITILFAEMYRGFYIHERFSACVQGRIPQDWEASGPFESGAKVHYLRGYESIRSHTLLIENGRRVPKPMKVYKEFECKADEKFSAEFVLLFPYLLDKNQSVNVSLCSDKEEVFTLKTTPQALYHGDDCLRNYSENVWQTIKMTGDIENNKVTVFVNGKTVKEIPFDKSCDFVNGLVFNTREQTRTVCMISCVYAYPELPLPEDYPSKPNVVDTHGKYVGMQSCHLWFEGDNVGWDLIEPWEERKPYLGFYYDGLSEVRDWEIKWLSEHGINFMLPCWYLPDGYMEGPFMGENAALESYFNSQYKEYFKFAIQLTGVCSTTVENMKKYVIPYWIDYYFTDPNYLVIDNKPLIAITFVSGSSTFQRDVLDYIREECRKIGFDGAYIIGGEQHRTQIHLEKTDELGLDGIFAYTWGGCSAIEGRQQEILMSQYKNSKTNVVPTLSQGYDERAWQGIQSGTYIPVDIFDRLVKWTHDEFMPMNDKDKLGSKVMLLDNWNEYGEGHFFMPTSLCGFAYLDSVRDAFCGKSEHEDVVPDENQMRRLEAMHPQGRNNLKIIKVNDAVPDNIMYNWDFADKANLLKWKLLKDAENVRSENGALCGTATGSTPMFEFTEPICFNGLDVPYIRFTLKTENVFTMLFKIYYITEDDREWNESKSFAKFIREADYETCTIFTQRSNLWKNNIVGLRIQPVNSIGDFYMKSVELLGYDERPVRWQYKDTIDSFFAEPIIENGCMLASPLTLPREFEIIQKWDYINNVVSISAKGQFIDFPIGKAEAVVNGKTEKLDAAAVIKERIAYLPIEFLLAKIFYKTTYIEKEKLVLIEK